MTATARTFRAVLADQTLTRSSAAEAQLIVERAIETMARFKTEIAPQTTATALVDMKPVAVTEKPPAGTR